MKTETLKTVSYIHPTVKVVSLKPSTVLCQSGLEHYLVDAEEEIE